MYWYSPSLTSNLSNSFIIGEQVPCPFSCKCWSHPNQRCRRAQPLLLFLYKRAQSVHHIRWDCSVPFQCSAMNTSPTLTRGTGAYPLSPRLVVRSNRFRKQVQYWSHIPSFQGVLRQKYMYQQLPADYIMVCVLTFRLHPSY